MTRTNKVVNQHEKTKRRRAGRCLSCHKPHHDWKTSNLIVTDLRERTGRTSLLHDNVIGDAAYHLIVDSYRVQALLGDREIDQIVAVIGTALGHMVAAATSRGREQGRDEGVERFFKELIDEMGPGRYEMEIGVNGLPVRPVMVH